MTVTLVKRMNNLNHNSETISELLSFYKNNPDIKLEGKTDNHKKMRRFFEKIVTGGLKGNKIEFELSEDEEIYNREKTVGDILSNNPKLFEQAKTKKQPQNMLREAFRFYMERGNVLKAYDLKRKNSNILIAFLSIFFITKLLATAFFGVFAVLSSGELIKFSSIVANDYSDAILFSTIMFLNFVLYFGFLNSHIKCNCI